MLLREEVVNKKGEYILNELCQRGVQEGASNQ